MFGSLVALAALAVSSVNGYWLMGIGESPPSFSLRMVETQIDDADATGTTQRISSRRNASTLSSHPAKCRRTSIPVGVAVSFYPASPHLLPPSLPNANPASLSPGISLSTHPHEFYTHPPEIYRGSPRRQQLPHVRHHRLAPPERVHEYTHPTG